MIIILGKTGGLGKALTNYLHASPQLTEVLGGLRSYSRDDANLQDPQSVESLVQSVNREAAKDEALHFLNLTGKSFSGLLVKTPTSEIDEMVSVNLSGNLYLARELGKILKERPGSTLTLCSSVVCDTGVVGTATYAATKSALHGLVRSASKEWARYNGRINAIQLGYFAYGMIGQVPDSLLDEVKKSIPLARLGNIQEFWSACDFLIRNGYMTGNILRLTGGLI